MSNRRSNGTWKGIALGLIFAILGMLIGGVVSGVWFAFTLRGELPPGKLDPQAQEVGKLLRPVIDLCLGFFVVLIGGGVGATIGGIAGGVLGARSAARKNAALSTDDSDDTIGDSRDDEVARLEAQVARLQDRIDNRPRDDRFRSGENPSPGSSDRSSAKDE